MKLLALDIGSTSIKAAIVSGDRIVGKIARVPFPTRFEENRAEVDPRVLLKALVRAIADVGPSAKKADTIAFSVMSPAWIAMDHEGRPLTPIVTHQDRRSTEIAIELERRFGKQRYLKLAGNRPVPGAISCTTWAWFLKHEPAVMKRADLCGHLNTFLHRTITHARIIDPSNASFTGLYETTTQKGWNDALMANVGIQRHRLPQVIGADGIGGFVAKSAAAEFGLMHGTPVLAGCVDGSAAMLLAGAKPGQLTNVTGSTDVLALCVDKPHPDEQLITRALGVEKKWLSVATLAAGGATLDWAHQTFFADLDDQSFWKLVKKISKAKTEAMPDFAPYLAGERTSVEPRTASLSDLTLATTRQQILASIIEALARASADRLKLLRSIYPRLKRKVVTSGGVSSLGSIMQRDWAGKWDFQHESEAALRGLGKLVI